MYFQKNPVFTGVILCGFGALLLLRKRRKNNRGNPQHRVRTGFLSSKVPVNNTSNDLVTLVVLQQMFSSRKDNQFKITGNIQKIEHIKRLEGETLNIFDSEQND